MIASLGRLPATKAWWNFCSSRVSWPTNGDHSMSGRKVRRNTANESRATAPFAAVITSSRSLTDASPFMPAAFSRFAPIRRSRPHA